MGGVIVHCLGNRWGPGHKYIPRYDEKTWGPQWLENTAEHSERHTLDITGYPKKDHTKTYVQDVCVRCGEVVKRQ